MSFDLQAFPPSGPRTVSEVRQLLDAEEQRWITGTDDPLAPLGPEMAWFVDEIKAAVAVSGGGPGQSMVCFAGLATIDGWRDRPCHPLVACG